MVTRPSRRSLCISEFWKVAEDISYLPERGLWVFEGDLRVSRLGSNDFLLISA
jgi:hypothetical protein